eukprot:13611209-Heterocapsa_arctica.AAC.1
MHSIAHPGTRMRELITSMGWGRRMATPPWWPPPGPGRDGHGTTFAEGKSPCHCAAAAACQC